MSLPSLAVLHALLSMANHTYQQVCSKGVSPVVNMENTEDAVHLVRSCGVADVQRCPDVTGRLSTHSIQGNPYEGFFTLSTRQYLAYQTATPCGACRPQGYSLCQRLLYRRCVRPACHYRCSRSGTSYFWRRTWLSTTFAGLQPKDDT